MVQATGKAPRILVLETAPSAPSAGHSLATEVENLGLAVEVDCYPDVVVELSSLAITGADAVAPAFIVNGSPTLALARACHGRISYYVVGESVKVTSKAVGAPGYDLVPVALVSGVVTEEGTKPVKDT